MRNILKTASKGIKPLSDLLKFILWVSLFSYVIISLTSCSTKRAERILRRNSELKHDTVEVVVTDTVEMHLTDTVTTLVHDKTIQVINNERVRLEYKYDTITNEIYHEVECKEYITEPRVVRVPVEKYILPNAWDNFVSMWPLYLTMVLTGLIVWRKIKNT